MQAAGIKSTAYVISSLLDTAGYLTTAQAQEMYVAGHDIGNHSTTHVDFGTITQGQAEAELTGCKNALDAAGMPRASAHVAYPFGGHGGATHAAMTAAGMITGRLTTDGNVSLDEANTYGLQYLKVKYLHLAQSLPDAINMVYYAMINNEKIAFLLHAIVDTPSGNYEWSTENFAALIAYCQSKDIPILSISEWKAAYDAAYP